MKNGVIPERPRAGFRRVGAAFFAAVYAATNVACPHAVEANFWAERKQAAARMQPSAEAAPDPSVAAAPAAVASLTAESRRLLDQLPAAGAVSVAGAPAASAGSGLSLSPSSVGSALPAPDVPASAGLLSLLLPYGSIREVHLSPDSAAPLVIHVQDAHGVEEAQRNIAGLIQTLQENRGLGLVGVEGAEGPLTLVEPLRTLGGPGAARDAATAFLKDGLIGGAEYAALTSPRAPVLWGVEDMADYRADVRAVKDSLSRRAEAAAFLEPLAARVAALKEAIYSPALKAFDREAAGYRDRTEPLGRYARYLMGAAPGGERFPNLALLVRAFDAEAGLDFRAVERERIQLVERLARALPRRSLESLVQESLQVRLGRRGVGEYHAYLKELCRRNGVSLQDLPQMRAYVDYVLLADGIDRERLLEEMDAREAGVEAALADTEPRRRLARASRQLALAGKLVRHEMTPADWAAYQDDRAEVLRLHAELASLEGKTVPSGTDAAGLLAPFEDFCRLALARNGRFVSGLLGEMKAERARAAVLVAGGFHSEDLVRRLTAAGASVVVVTPKIAEAPKEPHYLDVFARDPLPLEKMFRGEVISLIKELAVTRPDAAAEIGLYEAAVDAPAEAAGNTLDALRARLEAFAGKLGRAAGVAGTSVDPREGRVAVRLHFTSGAAALAVAANPRELGPAAEAFGFKLDKAVREPAGNQVVLFVQEASFSVKARALAGPLLAHARAWRDRARTHTASVAVPAARMLKGQVMGPMSAAHRGEAAELAGLVTRWALRTGGFENLSALAAALSENGINNVAGILQLLKEGWEPEALVLLGPFARELPEALIRFLDERFFSAPGRILNDDQLTDAERKGLEILRREFGPDVLVEPYDGDELFESPDLFLAAIFQGALSGKALFRVHRALLAAGDGGLTEEELILLVKRERIKQDYIKVGHMTFDQASTEVEKIKGHKALIQRIREILAARYPDQDSSIHRRKTRAGVYPKLAEERVTTLLSPAPGGAEPASRRMTLVKPAAPDAKRLQEWTGLMLGVDGVSAVREGWRASAVIGSASVSLPEGWPLTILRGGSVFHVWREGERLKAFFPGRSEFQLNFGDPINGAIRVRRSEDGLTVQGPADQAVFLSWPDTERPESVLQSLIGPEAAASHPGKDAAAVLSHFLPALRQQAYDHNPLKSVEAIRASRGRASSPPPRGSTPPPAPGITILPQPVVLKNPPAAPARMESTLRSSWAVLPPDSSDENPNTLPMPSAARPPIKQLAAKEMEAVLDAADALLASGRAPMDLKVAFAKAQLEFSSIAPALANNGATTALTAVQEMSERVSQALQTVSGKVNVKSTLRWVSPVPQEERDQAEYYAAMDEASEAGLSDRQKDIDWLFKMARLARRWDPAKAERCLALLNAFPLDDAMRRELAGYERRGLAPAEWPAPQRLAAARRVDRALNPREERRPSDVLHSLAAAIAAVAGDAVLSGKGLHGPWMWAINAATMVWLVYAVTSLLVLAAQGGQESRFFARVARSYFGPGVEVRFVGARELSSPTRVEETDADRRVVLLHDGWVRRSKNPLFNLLRLLMLPLVLAHAGDRLVLDRSGSLLQGAPATLLIHLLKPLQSVPSFFNAYLKSALRRETAAADEARSGRADVSDEDRRAVRALAKIRLRIQGSTLDEVKIDELVRDFLAGPAGRRKMFQALEILEKRKEDAALLERVHVVSPSDFGEAIAFLTREKPESLAGEKYKNLAIMLGEVLGKMKKVTELSLAAGVLRIFMDDVVGGKGEYGSYVIRHGLLEGRPVLVKTPELGEPGTFSEELIEGLEREARIFGEIGPFTHDGGLEGPARLAAYDPRGILVMEDAPGVPLSQLMNPRPNPAQALGLVSRLLKALEALPPRFAHRGIGLSNVLFDEKSGRMTLIGFASAEWEGKPEPREAWMPASSIAPAFDRPPRLVDRRDDILAAGKTLYDLLVGHYSGYLEKQFPVQENPGAEPGRSIYIDNQISDIIKNDAASEVAGIIIKAWAPDPDARYSSPADMRRAVEATAQRIERTTVVRQPGDKVLRSGRMTVTVLRRMADGTSVIQRTPAATGNPEQDEYNRELLREEAKGLKRVSDLYKDDPKKMDHFQRILSYDEATHTLTVEYVPGKNLTELEKASGGRLPLKEALHILRAMVTALSLLHAADLVHRDLKPDNFMYDRESGRATLIDFGLTAEPGDTPGIIGTVRYLPPEVIENKYTKQSDLYGVTVTAYELIYGHPFPNPGHYGKLSEIELIGALAVGDLMKERVSSVRATKDLPLPIRRFLLKGLAPKSGDRFGSPEEMLAALEPLIAMVDRDERWNRPVTLPEKYFPPQEKSMSGIAAAPLFGPLHFKAAGAKLALLHSASGAGLMGDGWTLLVGAALFAALVLLAAYARREPGRRDATARPTASLKWIPVLAAILIALVAPSVAEAATKTGLPALANSSLPWAVFFPVAGMSVLKILGIGKNKPEQGAGNGTERPGRVIEDAAVSYRNRLAVFSERYMGKPPPAPPSAPAPDPGDQFVRDSDAIAILGRLKALGFSSATVGTADAVKDFHALSNDRLYDLTRENVIAAFKWAGRYGDLSPVEIAELNVYMSHGVVYYYDGTWSLDAGWASAGPKSLVRPISSPREALNLARVAASATLLGEVRAARESVPAEAVGSSTVRLPRGGQGIVGVVALIGLSRFLDFKSAGASHHLMLLAASRRAEVSSNALLLGWGLAAVALILLAGPVFPALAGVFSLRGREKPAAVPKATPVADNAAPALNLDGLDPEVRVLAEALASAPEEGPLRLDPRPAAASARVAALIERGDEESLVHAFRETADAHRAGGFVMEGAADAAEDGMLLRAALEERLAREKGVADGLPSDGGLFFGVDGWSSAAWTADERAALTGELEDAARWLESNAQGFVILSDKVQNDAARLRELFPAEVRGRVVLRQGTEEVPHGEQVDVAATVPEPLAGRPLKPVGRKGALYVDPKAGNILPPLSLDQVVEDVGRELGLVVRLAIQA